MKPTLIDRAIGAISPRMATQRMRWRATMNAMQHFDAAGRSQRTQGWRTPGGDANAALGANSRIRLVVRDMARNNAIARSAIAKLVDNLVGDGFIPSVEASSDRLHRQVMERVLEHCDTTSIDAAGRTNLYGLQRLAVAGLVTDGEAIWRRRPRLVSDPRRPALPFQLEALEPEHIDHRPHAASDAGLLSLDGIEFDANNRRVAYRLFRHHPEDGRQGFPEVVRVTAENVMHLYRVDRPGQHRGVSWLAPVVALINDAYDYADAQLMRQKIAAMWVAFTKDTGEIDDPGTGEFRLPETLTPGMFEHLPIGRDVVFSSPPPTEGYGEHMKAVQRMIAAALCLTYEEMSGDLEGVNFSSARLGRLAMRRAVTAAQWTVIMPAMCEPLNRWLREAVNERIALRGEWKLKWTPPPVPMTDPAREIPAIREEIEAGLTSRSRKIREMGFDPEEINREIADDLEQERKLGLSFGAAQARPEPAQSPARPNERDEIEPDQARN